MKIAIISSDSRLYSTRRLREAAQERGHSVRVLHPNTFSMHIEQGNPELSVKGKRISQYDAVIPRIGVSLTYFGTAIVRQFEQMGIYSLNPSHAISVARDKLRTMQILSRHNIGLPPTSCVTTKADVPLAIEHSGGTPVIIKLLGGTQGAGVMLADSPKIAEAIVEALRTVNQHVIIQKFVSESKGQDIRAFVVGDKVIGAMRRTAEEGEFRSNVHLGAATEAVKLSEDYERTALLAAHILGLRVAGVDLLETSEGPKVLEVNASPGLEGIEQATKIDIAAEIIAYLESEVSFPDIDLRERLSVGRGYSIAEVNVVKKSPLLGKSIEEAGLLKQEIQVLRISRNNLALPIPSPQEKLLLGDTLLLFGKQLSLRALLPASVRGRSAANSGSKAG